ncbi:hypothetical protein PCANC_11437 [Puccinia coronata f. sp. avenae]|uniref:Uncharacterized protein n=1 Tax=Puccinia coronata f. sp. avenae TaxID=200324 RepID=A0A2N5VMM6_9BASI|nr:hypothetical protein PCANC_11437 [Puccinia coronata f. sp. avenae]
MLQQVQSTVDRTGASVSSCRRQVPLLSSGPGSADPAAQQRPLSWVSATSLSSRQLAAAVAGSGTAASHRRSKWAPSVAGSSPIRRGLDWSLHHCWYHTRYYIAPVHTLSRLADSNRAPLVSSRFSALPRGPLNM